MLKKTKFHIGNRVRIKGEEHEWFCLCLFNWGTEEKPSYREGTEDEAWWIGDYYLSKQKRDVFAYELILVSDEIQRRLE